ncbi:FAD-dependent oxidoreductase [Halobacillus naozhouensis]|uniref:FAD-dependent oxidoreductase n=1 Tax=Halobacillus naozhouensis TaxID=554880 RepID=A0ABY8J0E2_9BACI|nr:FAD-dependent oxidoreductase [Halobacillus naozhouensis]WFT75541.1 FAD-dependent oxidoreductase [Halobacillus naozhouensis]
MATYHVKLLKKETIANDTMAFHWEKPKGFEFKAGQHCEMTLANSEVTKEEKKRVFSMAYAPFEKDVVTATRMSDSTFKELLKDFPEGAEVKFSEPSGDFTLHNADTTPAVFIIGGIGITPVRSIIAQATYDKMPHKITLMYSNNTPEDVAFMTDLKGFAERNSNFSFVPVMTETQAGEWNGETGFIDANMLKRHVPDISAPIYYLSGPAGMVQDMRKMLTEAGANEANIRTEEFSGYE